MRLELVGSTQPRGDTVPGQQGIESQSGGQVVSQLDAALRDLAGVRERLQILIDHAAALRRRLRPPGTQG